MNNNSQKSQITISREGYAKIKKELDQLIKVERPRIIHELKIAREQGDLKENADYDISRNQQAQVEHRIREIEEILAKITISSKNASVNKNQITIGSHVKVKNLKTNKIDEFIITSTFESDISAVPRKISTDSVVGAHLINKNVGDDVKFFVPSGAKHHLKIIEIK